MNIRSASPDDAERLLEIYAPYVAETASSFEYDVPTVEEFRGRIENTLLKYPYLVADEDGRAVGYCYAGRFHSREAYLHSVEVSIYIDRNYRRREEHGSAKWGVPGQVNSKYADRNRTENKILTQNVAIGLDGRKHRRNLNTLVVGGSGAGKTRFFAKPNIMNANTSFVVLDPKGELLASTGTMLSRDKGYEVKVLDLINMEKSHCYNPFVYLRSDNDIQRLVTNLFKNTTPKGSQSQDPFWDQAATMLLLALIFYLHYEAPPEEQNFPMVMDMIRAGEVREDDEGFKSTLDILFDRLEMRNPEHIALKYYKSYHSGSGKTLKSIQITLISRLEKFNLKSRASHRRKMFIWSLLNPYHLFVNE